MRWFTSILLSIFSLYTLPLLAADATPQDASGLHLEWLDRSVSPAQDFFEFANGSWRKQNPVPAAYPIWSVMAALGEKNLNLIHQLITEISAPPPESIPQKISDFYYSGMDEATIDKLGTTPLQPEFLRIEHIKKISELQHEIAHLQLVGIDVPFGFGQMQDFANSHQVIGVADQSGLSLPDRDYYLKKDKKFADIRQAYTTHIIKMLELLGDSPEEATHEAKTILAIETALAKASISRIEARNPHAIYHLMTLTQLQNVTPNFDWRLFFADIGHPEIKQINLSTPRFFTFMNTQLKNIALKDWKIYLRWHLIQATAPFLSKPFVDESFSLAQKLTGTKVLLPRWKRVVHEENSVLGFAIGKLYVEKMFPPSSKKAVKTMLTHIRTALKNDLKTLSWMTPATREAALKKLDLMEERIGYPDKWRDYSKLRIDRGSYILNIMRSAEFLTRYELNKIGKPVDPTEWDMLPQQVNAYYDPSRNNLNIPAGILQPPLFDPKASAAVNYGAIGSIMGHEMTHAFDDEGAQFDSYGNLKNWWTGEDLKKFQLATRCIANHFSHYKIEDGLSVQGKLVTGEATADLGGLMLAFKAYHASSDYAKAKVIEGFTPDQQFFLGAAHVWALNIRPEAARLRIITDPHPPAHYRVNGTFANMPQFQTAFNVPDNSPMVNQDRCVIW